MRRVLVVVLVVLATASLGLYLFLSSPERVIRSLQWAIDELTPMRLEIKGLSTDPDTYRINASEVLLYQDATSAVPLVSLLDFKAQGALTSIPFHRLEAMSLEAGSVTIYVTKQDETDDPTPAAWMQYLAWLPKRLVIGGLYVVAQDNTTWVLPLKQLTGERSDHDHFQISGVTDYEEEPLDIRIFLSALRGSEGFRGIELRGEFHATRSSRLAIMDGEFRGGVEDFSYDFSLNAAIPDIRVILRSIEGAPDIAGYLQVQGRMQGDLKHFELTDAQFHLANDQEYQFEAKGDFYYQGKDQTRLDLTADGQMARLNYLLDWVDVDLTGLGRADASLKLSGSLNNVVVDHFELHTLHPDGLEVDIAGALGRLGDDLSLEEQRQLDVTLHGPTLSVLKPWLGELPFEPGPWQIKGQVSGSTEAVQVEAIDARLGDPQTTQLTATGGIGKVDLATPITAASVTGIDVELQATATTLKELNQWFDLSLPPTYPANAKAKLAGSGDQLSLSDGKGRVGQDAMALVFSGFSTQLEASNNWRPSNIHGQVSITLASTAELSQLLTDTDIPDYGPANATATLRQTGKGFALDQLKAGISGPLIVAKGSGGIADLTQFDGLALKLQIERLDTRYVLERIGVIATPNLMLGDLGGNVELRRKQAIWSTPAVDLSSTGSADIAIKVSGSAEDVTGAIKGDMALDISANADTLLALTGRPLPRLTSKIRAQAREGNISVSDQSSLGSTRWSSTTDLKVTKGALSGLKMKIESPQVNLVDLGLQADSETPAASEKAKDSSGGGLAALIPKLPTYPLSLDAHLGGIAGEHTRIDDLQLNIEGQGGHFLLRTLNISYEKAVAELRGVIDLKAQPPAISIGGQALSIDMTQLVKDLGIKTDIEGVLNLRGGLSARGTESEQWLQSLDGNLALALEDAIIEGAAYDVLATDLLAWLYSGAALQKSTSLECAMARFDFKSGIASTDSIFIESPRMVASGEGKIDLVKSKLDITIEPRSKNRLVQFPSEVTLKGELSSPKTHVSPIKATANASAEALLLIPRLTMKLFGIEMNKQDRTRPCEASLKTQQSN